MPARVDQEVSRRHAERLLSEVSLGDWSVLIKDIADDLDDVYADGLSEGMRLTDVGVSVDQVNTRAVTWARERAASLVTMIEDNTRDMLRTTVATGVEEGWSAVRLAEEIAKSPAFDDDRVMMIAHTEINMANNAGNLEGYKEASRQGVRVLKECITAGDDLVSEGCQENEDEGPIELDEEFPSGDDTAPFHPVCRCSVAPYLPDEDEEEE